MAAAPIKVLVVDDSAFARKVLRECLSAAGLEVVGIAHDGLEALEMISALSPDVITLDLVMPNLDGLGVLRALAGKPAPRVVVVSMSDSDSMLGMAALQEGAFEVVHKPTALAVSQLYEIGDKLVEVVRAAALSPLRTAAEAVAVAGPVTLSKLSTTRELVVIGASTGGPQALTHLMAALPANFPVAVALVLHIPPGYTAALARRLDEICALEVLEAAEGLELKVGRVIVARAGRHLKLIRRAGGLQCKLDVFPVEALHRPAVDVLFQTAAEVAGAHTLGVVLTGMGDDGLAGARAIGVAGGLVLTESESSCVVYGMPRVVMEAGLSAGQAPIERMAEEIIRFL
ncbi:MAG: chemotaxis response regulator protein-glutamate methylesterase [Myxococcaceae bacterium]|nr:chemotaxis response regulator protein-glutamate methylesterase [Myxococcaceae bacterium]